MTAPALTEIRGASYYRARYYDPQTGRFLSEDPLGYGSYAFVRNKATGYVDPSGLTEFKYNLTYRGSINGESWWSNGQFKVDSPPVVRYDCRCIGNGKYKLTLTVTWDVLIIYASYDQLLHEEGHLQIFKRWWDLRRSHYENKYENIYNSLTDCEAASWKIRDSVIADLQRDFGSVNSLETPHDDPFQRAWQWFTHKW